MGNVILGVGTHRKWIQDLLGRCQDPVRIASAYVTETGLFSDTRSRDVRLLTGLSMMDLASGATSLDSLEALIQRGVQCRFLSEDSRLHAKVYIFGAESAIVTSANFTMRALNSNIEVGVKLGDSDVGDLIRWFDGLWVAAEPLDVGRLTSLRRQTAELRQRFDSLRVECQMMDGEGILARPASDPSLTQTESSCSYFLCNTDRSHAEFSPSSGYEREEAMRKMCFVAAWEDFSHTSHMKAVKRGDIIFMYANGAGVIGIGTALGPCEILARGNPGRISQRFSNKERGREWRIPVEWLKWLKDEDACPWNRVLPPTFQAVSDEKWLDHREKVLRHFFDDRRLNDELKL